jgi:ABC-type transport system involved in cytochrome c biogenesis permease subunit
MIDGSLLFLGVIGFISVLAIALSRLIDKPAPGRNFMFSLLISIFAMVYVEGMAQWDTLQVGVFKLGFIAFMIFASLIGSFICVVLVTIYRGNILPAIFSGAVTGIATFFTGYFIPPNDQFYPAYGFHDLSSLLRLAIPFGVGFLSYVFFSIWIDSDNSSD